MSSFASPCFWDYELTKNLTRSCANRFPNTGRRLAGETTYSSATKADCRLLIRAFHRLICGVILQRERSVFVRIVLEFREALVTADRNVLALI